MTSLSDQVVAARGGLLLGAKTLAAKRLASGKATVKLAAFEGGEFADAERALGRAKIDAEWDIFVMDRLDAKNAEGREIQRAHYLMANEPYQRVLTEYRQAERTRNGLRTAALTADVEAKAEQVRYDAVCRALSALVALVGTVSDVIEAE